MTFDNIQRLTDAQRESYLCDSDTIAKLTSLHEASFSEVVEPAVRVPVKTVTLRLPDTAGFVFVDQLIEQEKESKA